MFYAEVFKDFLFVFLYLIMCIFFLGYIHFFFFLYLILFCAGLENMVRKGPMCICKDMDYMMIMVCPAGHWF